MDTTCGLIYVNLKTRNHLLATRSSLPDEPLQASCHAIDELDEDKLWILNHTAN